MPRVRAVTAATMIVALVASGCFGSRLRRMGETERAAGIAVEQGPGLALIAGGILLVASVPEPEEDGMPVFPTSSLLAAMVPGLGAWVVVDAELRDFKASGGWYRYMQRGRPLRYEKWKRRCRAIMKVSAYAGPTGCGLVCRF